MFDPYREWLEIPSDRRPPTNYELLGLPPYESDAASIHNAAMDRLALVRRYQLGEHGEVVFRLLGELSAAFDCLSDPARRSVYDEQLRTMAETRTLPPVIVSATRAPKAPAGGRPPQRRRLPRSYGGLAAVALVVTTMAVMLWFSRQPAKTTQQTELVGSRTDIAVKNTMGHADGPQPDRPKPAPFAQHAIRYFGYATQGPGRVIDEIAPYTNIVFVRDWMEQPSGVLRAAKRSGLPMVLCIQGKEMVESADRLGSVLDLDSEPVLAVCWFNPSLSGFKSTDLRNVGRRIKDAHPKVQLWIAEIDKPQRPSEITFVPPVVDALVIMNIVDTTPAEVHATADACLADWKAKAAGRPLIWYWLPGNPFLKEGVVPSTKQGTLRACLDVARRHELAGLIFDRYGKPPEQERIPIDSRPDLVEEIRQMSRELGFDVKSATTSSPR